MFFGIGATSSVIQEAGSPRVGDSADPKALVVLVNKAFHAAARRHFEQVEGSGDVGVHEVLTGVRHDMRPVQCRGVDNRLNAALKHFSQEIPVCNRANTIGVSRCFYVDADCATIRPP
jgi:hypothetical protein